MEDDSEEMVFKELAHWIADGQFRVNISNRSANMFSHHIFMMAMPQVHRFIYKCSFQTDIQVDNSLRRSHSKNCC